MKQIVQNLKNGETILEDVPTPLVKKDYILIKTSRSLVSLGTEKMLVEFGKGNLISKARQQPDKVKIVLDKIKTEGLLPTLEAVFNKLDEPLPLGYCNVGKIIAIGDGVRGYNIGDRVASNGNHAEVVCIPKNLVVKIPDLVSDDEATFTVIGSIGLQGIRLLEPTLGETFVVIGLGLIGLITAELLISNGCNVIGFDFDPHKIELANKKGILAFNAATVDVVKTVESITSNLGADGVIITASSKGNEVIEQAAKMSRKRGRIILVGVVGLDIQRADFYKKELKFQVSCSYGPGRYDEEYESKGIDYPISYVRWTEKRNFETILDSIKNKKINVLDLITEKYDLTDYLKIYNRMGSGSIASILKYPNSENTISSIVKVKSLFTRPSKGIIGIIGAGNFTKMTVMPVLKNCAPHLKYISSAGGLTAKSMANKYGFEFCTTDYQNILNDDEVDIVLITTRHDQHAKMVIETLNAGKHVFVEKPLALNESELFNIADKYNSLDKSITITVGFNRRFSPFVEKAKKLLSGSENSLNIIVTINAGYIPPEVWVQDLNIGGGRIIGEACHFVDLMIYLTDSLVSEVSMSALGNNPNESTDNAIIVLKFDNGSQGVINYFSNGSKSYSKERIEVYSQGRTLLIDNFRKMKGYGFRGFSSMSGNLDKGHKNQFIKLINLIKEGGKPLIKFEEIYNTTLTTFSALKSLKSGKWEKI